MEKRHRKPAKTKKSEQRKIEVEFDYESMEAKEVFLAGDFNGWDFHSLPMKRDNTGIWRARFPLPPGEYQYRFIVDGDWQNDPLACGYRPNEFGSSNCVVEVREASSDQKAHFRTHELLAR